MLETGLWGLTVEEAGAAVHRLVAGGEEHIMSRGGDRSVLSINWSWGSVWVRRAVHFSVNKTKIHDKQPLCHTLVRLYFCLNVSVFVRSQVGIIVDACSYVCMFLICPFVRTNLGIGDWRPTTGDVIRRRGGRQRLNSTRSYKWEVRVKVADS